MIRLVPYLIIIIVSLFLTGCLANEGAHNGKIGDVEEINQGDNSPIAYNTKQEEIKRQGMNLRNETEVDKEDYLEGYQSHLNKPNNQNSSYTQAFYNEDSEKVANEINKLEEVKLTQAIVTEDRVIVSAALEQVDYSVEIEEIMQKIHDRAAQTIPGKEVYVYTDSIYWNKMRDLNSRLKNADGKDASAKHINHFFENLNDHN